MYTFNVNILAMCVFLEFDSYVYVVNLNKAFICCLS